MFKVEADSRNNLVVGSSLDEVNHIEELSEVTFSLSDLNKKYSLYVNDGLIKIVSNQGSVATYQTKKEDERYYRNGPSHVDGDMFYFVLDSYRYTRAKYIYCFDPKKNSIQCILAPLKDPNFVRNRLVEFGSGCNEDSYRGFPSNGLAVIRIFDLNRPQGSREVKKHILKDGSGDWDCCIVEKEEKIMAADQFNRRQEFPIFEN